VGYKQHATKHLPNCIERSVIFKMIIEVAAGIWSNR
jgi:hypothetical protein